MKVPGNNGISKFLNKEVTIGKSLPKKTMTKEEEMLAKLKEIKAKAEAFQQNQEKQPALTHGDLAAEVKDKVTLTKKTLPKVAANFNDEPGADGEFVKLIECSDPEAWYKAALRKYKNGETVMLPAQSYIDKPSSLELMPINNNERGVLYPSPKIEQGVKPKFQ